MLGVRLKAFVLGRLDMMAVHDTATYLLGEHTDATGHDAGLPVAVRRVVETGLVVTYARPFTSTRGGFVLPKARGLSPELLQTHNQLLDLRKQFFAHNDDTPWRQLRHPEQVEEPAGWPEDLPMWIREGIPVEGLLEQWTLPTRQGLEAIRVLADANYARFEAEIDRIVERLRAEAAA
jgi:hypothetical protein